MVGGLLGSMQEIEHVVVAESAVAALADPEERELAAVAQSLDGIDVQMQHLGDLGRREQLADLVRHHRWYLVLVWGTRHAPVAPGKVRSVRLVFG